MKSSSTLAFVASVLGAQAAVVPPCVNCRRDACMDAVIQSECGDYLVTAVETPATQTVYETVYATVVPTEISMVTLSKTVVNNITTTIPVVAYETVDYTVTVTQDATAVVTLHETQTITAQAGPSKRAILEDDYDLPPYATACTDIFQYSSACNCIGFTPGTSTAPVPTTKTTTTSTVTAATSTLISTIETITFTQIGATVSAVTTTGTVTISQAVETVPVTTTVATVSTTETVTETFVPAPTPTVHLSVDNGASFAEDIRVPPGAEIGVILSFRPTTTPARLSVDPISGAVELIQTPALLNPYSLYYYASNSGFSYLQVTTPRVAQILGVSKAVCSLDASGVFSCLHKGEPAELWLCNGRHAAVVFANSVGQFQASCASGARRITAVGVPA